LLLRHWFGAYCDAVMGRAGVMTGMMAGVMAGAIGWANHDGWGDWLGLITMAGDIAMTGAMAWAMAGKMDGAIGWT
jgi:hypothetical protein